MSADRWFGLAITLVSLGMVAEVLQIVAPFAALGDPGPRIVPLILAAGLAVLGLVLLFRPTRRIAIPKAAPSSEEAPASTGVLILPPPVPAVRLALTAAFLGYIFLFERLGFSIATFLFLAVAIFLLGSWTTRAAATAVAVAAVTTLAVGAFLHGAIGIPLPGVLVF